MTFLLYSSTVIRTKGFVFLPSVIQAVRTRANLSFTEAESVLVTDAVNKSVKHRPQPQLI